MNIWLVTIGEQLPIKKDIRKLRTAYLADELIASGHSVLWWSSAFDHLKKDWVFHEDTQYKVAPNYSIYALKGCGYKRNVSLKRFYDHRILAKKFKRLAYQRPLPDLIVVSMPTYDLAFEVLKFANQFNVPVVTDIRDKWPDVFIANSPLPEAVTKSILRFEYKMLRYALKHSVGLTAVSNTFLSWALEHAGRSKTAFDQVFYLGYLKNQGTQPPENRRNQQLFEDLRPKFVATFIGTFAEFHNPSIVIECARQLEHDPRIHFVLAGDGQLMSELQQMAQGLTNITFTGWLDQCDIDSLLNVSDVGLCTTNKNADLFPNKACSYLAYGLPVLSAFEGDLRSFVENDRVGFYFDKNNVQMLVDQIVQLKNDKDLYALMHQNALNVYQDKLSGENLYKNYVSYLEGIMDYSQSKGMAS